MPGAAATPGELRAAATGQIPDRLRQALEQQMIEITVDIPLWMLDAGALLASCFGDGRPLMTVCTMPCRRNSMTGDPSLRGPADLAVLLCAW